MSLPKSPDFSLQGKRALVVGASSGIGLGCAVAIARAGAETTIVARRQAELDALAEALNAEGCRVVAETLDMAETEAVQAFIEQRAAFDVVINAAGLARHGPALEAKIDDFRLVTRVNLEAAYFLSTAVARKLYAENKGGSIVHISSQMAKVGGIERSAYCATKHGLDGMIKGMAIEWGKQNIRINSVCPTFVRTALTEKSFNDPEKLRWILQKIHLPRVAEVEDIMGAVLFLASDAAAMVTGTSIMVDGGWTAD